MNYELRIVHCALFKLGEEAVYKVEVGAAVVVPVLAQSCLVGDAADVLGLAHRESAFLLGHTVR